MPARSAMTPVLLVTLTAVTSLAGCGRNQPVYTVAEYDPARDPAADLKMTIRAAQPAALRVLIQVGSNGCERCRRLDHFVAEHPAVGKILCDGFVIMKVNRSDENDNAEFLAQYPEAPDDPHWYVLDSYGTLLRSQRTAAFEEGDSYSETAILGFLRTWFGRAD